MKKRIVSLILCGLMVFSAAGCSGGGENKAGKDDVTLTMWTHINEPWNAAYKDAIKEFESENEGVRIKLETFPYDEFESKVQTALIDGEGGADIYELWGGWALDFTPYGTLMELPEEMAEKVREENYEPTYGALEYEDKMYGIPLEYNIEYGGMLVNDTLLKAKGLTVPKTWEELRKTAIEGTEHDGNIFQCKGFDFVNWDSVPYYFLAFILQQDADYMTADGKFDVTTDAAKTASRRIPARRKLKRRASPTPSAPTSALRRARTASAMWQRGRRIRT